MLMYRRCTWRSWIVSFNLQSSQFSRNTSNCAQVLSDHHRNGGGGKGGNFALSFLPPSLFPSPLNSTPRSDSGDVFGGDFGGGWRRGGAMERVAAMATVSQASSLLAVKGSGVKQQKANVQSLGSCRVLSGGGKLVRGASGVRVVSTGTSGRVNGVVRVVSKQAAVSTPTKESAVEKEVYDCVVVGAGISGLCTAQALGTRHGVSNVLVTEARDRVGGNITTVQGDGFLWEEGPNSFQPNDSMLAAAIDSGLKDELVLGDPQSPRYVLWGGRLRPVPAGPADLPFFDLLSIFGKLRAGFGAMGLKPAAPGREESVKEFVTRNLGQEVFERLIEPFCSGVYAGDPSKLSMKAAFGKVWRLEEIGGSIIGGTFKTIQERKKNPPPPRDERLPKPKGQTVGSFKKGLITLPNAIAAQLGDKVKVNWKLTTIKKTDAGYTLTYETPEGTKTVKARSLVLTVPAYVAKEILRPLSEGAAEALSQFYYPPVCAVTISYPLSALREDRLTDGKLFGFGQLHPRSQGVQTLGTIYSSSLFPNRAPEDRVLLLNYIGGAKFTQITEKSDEEIVKTVDKDLRTMLLKPDAPAPQMHGVRTWPTAIPQFTIGHLDHLESAREALKSANCEGLFLGGNYVVGVALGRCVEGAYESAQAISQYVSQIPAKTGSA